MKSQNSNIRVIISGGGTGGHVFPAIAIANALKRIVPDINILFVGAKGRMEMEKVPAAGYPCKNIPTGDFQWDNKKPPSHNIFLPVYARQISVSRPHSRLSAHPCRKKARQQRTTGAGKAGILSSFKDLLEQANGPFDPGDQHLYRDHRKYQSHDAGDHLENPGVHACSEPVA